jgi:hypothetical protein
MGPPSNCFEAMVQTIVISNRKGGGNVVPPFIHRPLPADKEGEVG